MGLEEDEGFLDVRSRAELVEKSNIDGVDLHDYVPYTNSYEKNDEIRVIIQNKDAITLPCESVIVIEGKLEKTLFPQLEDEAALDSKVILINNAWAFLFSEIRYEINGTVVDFIRNPGIASTMKYLPSHSVNERACHEYAAWCKDENLLKDADDHDGLNQWLIAPDGSFRAHLPLNLLLGFAEDHRRIVTGVVQELVLVRSRTDNNCFQRKVVNALQGVSMKINRLVWRMPHAKLSDGGKVALTHAIDSQRPFPIDFMRWEFHELPSVQETRRNIWVIKTSSPAEIPQFVIFALQSNRMDQLDKNAGEFDHCKLVNGKLRLNEQFYPYHDMHLNFERRAISDAYDMMKQFEKSYYHRDPISAISSAGMRDICPFLIFDCSKRSESLLKTTVDIQIEFETSENIPPHTTAYCLLFYPCSFTYTPLSSVVTRVNPLKI